MAKIFAVKKLETGELTVVSWSSATAFINAGYTFIDNPFICLSSTSDYKDEGMYGEELEYISPETPMRNGERFRVAYTKEHVDAHNLLHNALKHHFKGKTFEPPIH